MRIDFLSAILLITFSIGLTGCGGGGGGSDDGSNNTGTEQIGNSITPSKTLVSVTPQRYMASDEKIPLNVSLSDNLNSLYWKANTDSSNSAINQITLKPFEQEPYISLNVNSYEESPMGFTKKKLHLTFAMMKLAPIK